MSFIKIGDFYNGNIINKTWSNGMEFIKKRSFKVFAIYRVLLGIVVYITFFVRMMH